MKKSISLLLLILIFQASHSIIPVLGQNVQDVQEIQEVIKQFISSCCLFDFDSAMSFISANYSCASCKNVKDYPAFNAALRRRIDRVSKVYIDNRIGDMRFNNLNIKDSKATVEIGFILDRFNLDASEDQSKKFRANVSLMREGRSWKISSWESLQQSE